MLLHLALELSANSEVMFHASRLFAMFTPVERHSLPIRHVSGRD